MDLVFFNEQQATPAATQTRQTKLAQIQKLFHQAIQRATFLNREILTSFTYTIPIYNPLHVYKTFISLNLGERLYWEQPTEQRAFVGAAIATSIQSHGSERFHDTAEIWNRLQEEAEAENRDGLLLLGGFAFDPQRPKTRLWEGFGDGLFLLPRFLYRVQKENATLSLNVLLKANDDAGDLSEEYVNRLQQLEEALAQIETNDLEQEAQVIGEFHMQNLIKEESWKELVNRAVRMIQHDDYKKIVLARSVQITQNEQDFDIAESLKRLRKSYPEAYIFAIQRGERTFIGATPERLLQAENGQVQTMALAGSAPRGTSAEEDAQIGTELTRSAKNKQEHNIVVNMVREALEQHCEKVWVADTPQLLRLKNIQHLETPIVGKLREGESILEVIHDLHPTPAVGGFPREAALEAIRNYESLDRGWYAGPVGWIDAAGNGAFAVALRSALVESTHATLFAGCGIVADSQPESEYAESCLKLKVMLRGLGAEE
jgi:isochorismate synthase